MSGRESAADIVGMITIDSTLEQMSHAELLAEAKRLAAQGRDVLADLGGGKELVRRRGDRPETARVIGRDGPQR